MKPTPVFDARVWHLGKKRTSVSIADPGCANNAEAADISSTVVRVISLYFL